jgi:hypothetical protein
MLLRDETLTALGTFDLLRVDAAELVRSIEHPHFGLRSQPSIMITTGKEFFNSHACFRQQSVPAQAAIPAARFGRSASCRARALPPKLFQATLLAFLQPAYLPIVGCGR